MCIHSSATGSGSLTLKAIVDIQGDKSTITLADGTSQNLTDTNKNKFMAAFAYFADNKVGPSEDYYATKIPFMYFWEIDGYRSYLKMGFPASSGQKEDNTVEAYQYAKTYANGGTSYTYINQHNDKKLNGTLPGDDVYSAKAFIYYSSGGQERVILFGTKVKEPEINKYISKVEYPDGTVKTYSRAGLKDSEKLSSAVTVIPQTKITYTIEMKGSSSKEYAITDTFETSALKYVSSTGLNSNLKGKMKPGETVTVTLEAKQVTSSSTKYYNRVVIDSTEKMAKDYIQFKYDEGINTHSTSGNYKKYITHVNNVPIGQDRTGFTSEYAKANPVTVKQGDKVTYVLEVENTSNYDIKTLTIKDTMEAGLSCDGAQTVSYTLKNIKAGKKATKTITVDVTKSNMYLLPIENKFEIISGKYIDVEEWINTWVDASGNSHSWIFYHEVEKDIKSSWFTSNSNKDYVQMDDVEIAGDVWVDANKDGIKDGSEKLLQGIKVKLYNGDTEVATTTTNDKGHYTFGKVQKGTVLYEGGTRKYADNSGYMQYNVVFEYFGVKYESTVYTDGTGVNDSGTTNNWNNKSHANESNISEANRQQFNNTFETIAYNKAYASADNKGNSKVLEYTKDAHTSTLNWTETTTIKSKSLNLYVPVSGGDTPYADNVEYLKHINLGLFERIQGDLSLKKDVASAKVSINGYSSTYNYGALNDETQTKYKGEYKLKTPYKLSLYKADYNFRYDTYSDTSLKTINDELNITLTYKVTITNDSDIFYTTLREVIDISSDTLELDKNSIKTEQGVALDVYDKSAYNSDIFNYSGYKTHYIRGAGFEGTFAPHETKTFYLTYTVNKDATRGIILGEKANIAQIGAFSIYTNSNGSTPAGVVDKDSNPGIVNKEVISTITDDSLYEDDSYYTSIIIQLRPEPGIPSNPDKPVPPPTGEPPTTPTNPPDDDPPGGDPNYNVARKITGNVWEDLNTEELGSGQKTGDGIRKTGENGAQNVTVVLLEVIEKVEDGKEVEYLVDTGIKTETDKKGDYVLENIHAGQYVVRFIYGDDHTEFGDYETQTIDGEEVELLGKRDGNGNFIPSTGKTIKFSGQDYKSTIYTPAGTETNEDEIIEVTAFRDIKAASSGQVSVAKDDELRRLEVIDYSTTMTYTQDKILKATTKKDAMELAANTSMFADTKKFNVQVEDPGNKTVELNHKDEQASGLVTYRYTINEVNFGLLERPYTKLELIDDIKEIIAITSSGEELLHIYFDIDYRLQDGVVIRDLQVNEVLSTGYENVQMLDRNNTTKGFRYVNIDSELLQGMKVIIKYQFVVANIGDIDTSNQNLINMVKNYDLDEVTKLLGNSISDKQYKYGTGSGISENLMKNYSYNNLGLAIEDLKNDGTYNKYRIFVGNSAKNNTYELGYFLGNSYYKEYNSETDKIVESRPDQILSYVDNDLVFKPEDNITILKDDAGNEYGQAEKFLTYTIQELKESGLLKGIDETKTDEEIRAILSDGEMSSESKTKDRVLSYITEDRNNLAFNIEDAQVNESLYRFSAPIKGENGTLNEGRLHVIQLEASRILASQLDVEDIGIDNLTEIVKMTNTVGRKSYIEILKPGNRCEVVSPNSGYYPDVGDKEKTGLLGNTPDVIRIPDDVVAEREIDTNFAETVTFSPPTGLTQKAQNIEKASNMAMIIVGIVSLVLIAGSTSLYLVRKKKFYK